MNAIDTAQTPAIARHDPIRGYQALTARTEDRHVALNTRDTYEARERMAQTFGQKEERSLLDATKDIAANLFGAFRNELRGALSTLGIRGEAAAELVRDVSKAFVDAVRNGGGFSFSMIAAAYKETIVQTETSVSHALEFSAKSLVIDYNHVTGELTADTSEIEIDAIKSVSSDGLPVEARALFDFTDSGGAPSLVSVFDRVQEYLARNDFLSEEESDSIIPALPGADEALYDAILINDEKSESQAEESGEDENAASPATTGMPKFDRASAESLTLREIGEYTNSRRETITRMTLDISVRVHLGRDDNEAESERLANRYDESYKITA